MTTRVLVSPGGPSLNRNKYGKEYFLLQYMARVDSEFTYETHFMNIDEVPPEPNISATASNSTRNGFYLWAFNTARKELSTDSVDIYHHMNYHYRFFNPLVIAGVTADVPTIIGPAQPPHLVPEPSKRDFVRKTTRIDWSDEILDNVIPVLDVVKNRLYDPIRQMLFAMTLHRADRVVVVNEETAELYAEHVSRSKIEVLPYGVVPERFGQCDPRESTDLVAVGSLYRRKGFHVLIGAWSKVASKFPDTKLHIIGSGPKRQRFEQLAAETGVEDSVVFHGFIDWDSVVEQLANARAFIHPSLSEGFPHVRLEAMASACPVIASDIIGTKDMIRDGTDGIVVPVNSVRPLADAISTLLSDPELAYEMGRNARDRVEAKHDWAKIAEGFIDIYRETLQAHGSS